MGFWSSVGSAISSGLSAVCSAVSSIGSAAVSFASECLPKVGTILTTLGGSLGMVANVVVAVCQILSILRQDESAEDLGDRALQAAENGIRPENFDRYDDYLDSIRKFEINPEKARNTARTSRPLPACRWRSAAWKTTSRPRLAPCMACRSWLL